MEAVAAEVGWMNRERRRARSQVMALLARDMENGINTPGEGGGEDQDKARILEYYKYNAFGSVTVLPVYDRDDTSASSVNSSGVFDSGIDDIPGSGSRTEWDLVENTPLTLEDNNTLMMNRRNGDNGHVAVGAGYGREGVFFSNQKSRRHLYCAEIGLVFDFVQSSFAASTTSDSSESEVITCWDRCSEEALNEDGQTSDAEKFEECWMLCQGAWGVYKDKWGKGGSSKGNCTRCAFDKAVSTTDTVHQWTPVPSMKELNADDCKCHSCQEFGEQLVALGLVGSSGITYGGRAKPRCPEGQREVCFYLTSECCWMVTREGISGGVALQYRELRCDFHFIHLDSEFGWVSKGGYQEAVHGLTDKDGMPTRDPSLAHFPIPDASRQSDGGECNRDFCGCFCKAD